MFVKIVIQIHKTIEFKARVSKVSDILVPNLASKLYVKLLASLRSICDCFCIYVSFISVKEAMHTLLSVKSHDLLIMWSSDFDFPFNDF